MPAIRAWETISEGAIYVRCATSVPVKLTEACLYDNGAHTTFEGTSHLLFPFWD